MQLESLHSALLSWYAKAGRHHLPWRDKNVKDRAYYVLVSEMMLQQTQVSVVESRYFFQFLQKFPTLETLSYATQEEVLLAWQGLGYYTRARNLHKLAKMCAKSGLPKDPKALQKLPGIGAYTAGAIACFGYDLAVSFVDSNIKRILTRIFALHSPTQSTLEAKAKEILNAQSPFCHNQALLDLGALICTAKSPKCNLCPISKWCAGKEQWQTLTSSKFKRNLKKTLHIAICVKDSKIALVKSQEKLYFGLYNFPTLPSAPQHAHIGILKHAYTKYTLKVHCYLIKDDAVVNGEFFPINALDSLPLSALALKILKLLQSLTHF